MLATPSILPNRPTNPAYKPPVSLKSVQVTPEMSDADTELAGPLRRTLNRLQMQAERTRDHFIKERDRDAAAVSDWSLLKESQDQSKQEYDRTYDALCEVETNPTAMDEDGGAADLFDQHTWLSKLICKQLISIKKVQSNTQALEMAVGGLNNSFNAAPDKNHSVALEVVLVRSKRNCCSLP